MSISTKLLTIVLSACIISCAPDGIDLAANATTSEIYTHEDFPEYCKLSTKIPDNLTALEYFNLAKEFADWELPAQAHDCVAKLRKLKLDNKLQQKLNIMLDTSLTKKVPPREAVLMNLTAKDLHQQREKGIALCNDCIRKYPEYENTYLTLANLYALNEKNQLSIETYRRALKINPHNTEALVEMGDRLISIHQFKEAKEAYLAANRLDPEDVMANSRIETLPQIEQASNPVQQAGNAIMDTIGMFFLPGALVARDAGALQTSGYIDKNGKFIYHRLNTTQLGHSYSCGLWFNYDHFEDKTGTTVGKDRLSAAEDFSEGLAAVKVLKWGFLDTKGSLAIKTIYDDARSFKEGLAPVKLNGRWGYLDKSGRWVLPPKFTGALSFSEGLAAVVSNGKVGYIDHKGQWVIQPKYDVGVSFSDGLATVTAYETEIKRHHQFVLDKTGKVKFDLTQVMQRLENTKEFLSSGEVYERGKADVLVAADCSKPIDRYSNAPAPDSTKYLDGLMLVSAQNKYGYLDREGKLVIPCKFGSAEPFREGLAPVSLDPQPDFQSGKGSEQTYGYIDKTGKFVIQPRYKWVSQFHEGLAHVQDKNGGGGFINHSGQLVIPVPGGWASDFSDGVAAVGEQMVYP